MVSDYPALHSPYLGPKQRANKHQNYQSKRYATGQGTGLELATELGIGHEQLEPGHTGFVLKPGPVAQTTENDPEGKTRQVFEVVTERDMGGWWFMGLMGLVRPKFPLLPAPNPEMRPPWAGFLSSSVEQATKGPSPMSHCTHSLALGFRPLLYILGIQSSISRNPSSRSRRRSCSSSHGESSQW